MNIQLRGDWDILFYFQCITSLEIVPEELHPAIGLLGSQFSERALAVRHLAHHSFRHVEYERSRKKE